MSNLPQNQFPFGVCPFMSSMQITAATPAGNIVPIGGGGSQTVVFTPAPCLGPQCQLWSGDAKSCSICELAENLGRSKK